MLLSQTVDAKEALARLPRSHIQIGELSQWLS